MSEREEGSLLVVVIDTNPSVSFMKHGSDGITKCLNGITVLCNMHLMLSSSNHLAVIACHVHKSIYLYPTNDAINEDESDQRPTNGQFELLNTVGFLIKERVNELVHSIPEDTNQTESLIAGAMSMALCYIQRIKKSKPRLTDLQSRILVVTTSGDSASQYMNFMNVFFTAQKHGITIDACILEKDAGILQQGCDITSGIYLKIPNIGALVQYLLWVFLPDVKTRKELVLPTSVHVDYRAACFCHRNLIEIGYVCSVCLSIFCAFSPICSTCQTAFKFMGPIANSKSKKRKIRLT